MLTEIKDRATGWIAWIIVIIISIPFALWGVNEYFAGGSSLNVAVVDGQEIDQQTYRYALEERRSMARRLLGNQFDPDSTNTIEFRMAVLDDLVLRQLLQENAEDAGFRVSDEQLAAFIRTTPQFQREGQFDSAAYQQAVQALGYTKVGFETYLRQQNMLQQMQDGLERSSFITARDEESLLTLAQERRVFDYAMIEPEAFESEISISEEEIKNYYNENPELYRSPEMIKVEYVQLAVADLAEDVEITEEDIKRYYEENKDLYKTREQRKASHILLKLDEDADEATAQEALRKAQSLAQKARDGEDFAELAKQHSQDPGSAALGGDLGLVEAGVMVKPFEDRLFDMREGEVSDPVKTRYGYHIIKLTELIAEQGQDLSEVYNEIEDEVRQRLAEASFVDRAETFKNLVFEQPESLQPVAEELELDLEASEWFSQGSGTGIAESEKVRDSAFSDDVYIENLNSEAIELDINTLVALRKIETQEASLKPLDEVANQIEQTLKQQKAREQSQNKGSELLAKLNESGDWDSLLAEHGLESQQAAQFRLGSDSDLPLRLSTEVFRAATATQEPVYGGVVLVDGSYTLFRLTEVEKGVPANADDNTKQAVAQSLTSRRGADYFLSYQRGLRESADIEIFEENM
ncbi:MAG: SurA N-terminal domain-containing protein [Arenicellales bacterium]|nr:SurA N-terminal domain-containing protein [Arenicellales bacterium]